MDGAAVRARAPDPGLTDIPHRVAFVESMFQRAELGIGLSRPRDLRLQQVRTFAVQAVKLEHEPADVPQLDLTQMAQVPDAATDPAARQKTRLGGNLRRGGHLRLGRRRTRRYPPAA